MSAAFTSGPWAVERDPYIHIRAKDGSQDGWGSTVYAGDYVPSEADANLIAAAPELYEALAGLVEANIKRGPFDEPLGSSEQTPEMNAAVAALAKARGDQ